MRFLNNREMVLFAPMLAAGSAAAMPSAASIPAVSEEVRSVTRRTPPSLTHGALKSLKILAVGNSFSIDAMEYLYQIMQEAGVKEIILGNLFVGGCSLSQHLSFARQDSPSYDYYKNTDGNWQLTKEYRLSDALVDEQWDYITVQQSSGSSGMCNTYYASFPEMLDYIQSRNSRAKFLWHMTWAYQADSTHEEFPLYENDQQTMYRQIIDCVRQCVLPDQRIAFVIPSGTAIQNARTSFLGDTLTRDGFHLDKKIGRYIAAMTWCAAITGLPIDSIRYNPDPECISQDMLAVAREAAKNAVATPFAVTRSEITRGERP